MSHITHCSEEVAQVVAYEFAAFDRLVERLKWSYSESGDFIPEAIALSGTGHGAEEIWEVSTDLESLLVHTRVLREFFYYFWNFKDKKYDGNLKSLKKRHDDDVIAQDFIHDWHNICPKIGEYLSTQKERLDKALAHLSTERIRYNQTDKRWDINKIYDGLNPVIRLFREHLPVQMADWFVLKPSDEWLCVDNEDCDADC